MLGYAADQQRTPSVAAKVPALDTHLLIALSLTAAIGLALALLATSRFLDRRRGIHDTSSATGGKTLSLQLICVCAVIWLVLFPQQARSLAKYALPLAGITLVMVAMWIVARGYFFRKRLRRVNTLLDRGLQGDFTAALHEAHEWSERNPSDPMPWVALAALYQQNQDWPAAEKAIVRYEKICPHGTDMLVRKPLIIAKQGRWSEADELYVQSIEDHPGQLGLLMDHCRLLVEMGRPSDAIKRYEAAHLKRQQFRIPLREHRELIDNQLEECRALIAPYRQDHDAAK